MYMNIRGKLTALMMLLGFTGLSNSNVVHATDTLKVGLNDLFEIAEAHNTDLSILKINQSISQLSIKETKNQLLPTIDATLAVSYNSDGRITDRNFKNGFTVDIPSFGNNFALEAKQLIYGGGAVNRAIEFTQLQQDQSVISTEVARQNIRFGIAGYYLEMKKISNQQIVIEKNITQTEKMITQIKAKTSQGVALKNNITRYELQLESLKVTLLQLKNAYRIMNNELVRLLDLSTGTILNLTEMSSENTVDALDSWNNQAMEHAPGLKLSNNDILLSEKAIDLVKAEKRPQVFAFAQNYFNGPIMIEIPVIDKNFNYFQVGVGVKYSISNLYKTDTKIKKAQLGLEMARATDYKVKKQLLNDIEAAQIKYQETKDIYHTRLKNIELAQQNYEVVKHRYLNDLSLITEMLDAENTKVDAELQAANAQINIIFHYYQLKKLSGTL